MAELDVIYNGYKPPPPLPAHPAAHGSRSRLTPEQRAGMRDSLRRSHCRSGGGCIAHNYQTGECNSAEGWGA